MDQTVAPDVRAESDADNVDVGPLDSSLGFLLRMAQLRVYDEFYNDLGDYDLKPGEFSVLTLIHKNPGIRQGVLARRIMIKRAHMTKLVRTFEDRGFVSRTIPDEDRRAVKLDLTDTGREFVERHWPRFYKHSTAQSKYLSPDEEKQMLVLLRKFFVSEEGDMR